MTPDNWISLGLLAIALVAAGVAVWQAVEARRNRIDAERAAKASLRSAQASERQAAAAERSVEIQEAANQKPPWVMRHQSGDTFAFINNTGRIVLVEDLDVQPEHADKVRARGNPEGRYEPADRFTLMYSRKFASTAAEKLTIKWRFEGEDQVRTYILVL